MTIRYCGGNLTQWCSRLNFNVRRHIYLMFGTMNEINGPAECEREIPYNSTKYNVIHTVTVWAKEKKRKQGWGWLHSKSRGVYIRSISMAVRISRYGYYDAIQVQEIKIALSLSWAWALVLVFISDSCNILGPVYHTHTSTRKRKWQFSTCYWSKSKS